MKFVVLCCLYAASLPILYLLVAALLAVAPLVDRLNLLRRFPKTKDTDDSLVRTALLFVMPIAVLLHLAMAYVEYEALLSDEARAHRTAGHASVVPVPFPIDADAYLAKDVTAAASEPIHANAPSDRPSHEQLGEIYAMRFVLLSLALNGAYLFFFIVREWVDFFFGYKIGVGLLQRFSVGATARRLQALWHHRRGQLSQGIVRSAMKSEGLRSGDRSPRARLAAATAARGTAAARQPPPARGSVANARRPTKASQLANARNGGGALPCRAHAGAGIGTGAVGGATAAAPPAAPLPPGGAGRTAVCASPPSPRNGHGGCYGVAATSRACEQVCRLATHRRNSDGFLWAG